LLGLVGKSHILETSLIYISSHFLLTICKTWHHLFKHSHFLRGYNYMVDAF